VLVLLSFFILFPLAMVLINSFSEVWAGTVLPSRYTTRWWQALATTPEFAKSIRTSVVIASICGCVATLFAFFVAYSILWERFPPRARAALDLLVMSPLYVATVVTGLSLLVLFSFLRGTIFLLLIGHFMVTLPLAYRAVYAVARRINREVIDAARSLGASTSQVWTRILLPLLKPGLIAGGALAFAWSMSDLGTTLFLFSPEYTTMPVLIMGQTKTNPSGGIALAGAMSAILVLVAVGVLTVAERLLGKDTLTL
jgi:putative spermidine/putrescine transport system permease protein